MNEKQVRRQAKRLRQHATHFVERDWDYTRNTGDLVRLVYKDDWTGYNAPHRRLKRWAKPYVSRKGTSWVEVTGREIAWRNPLIHARSVLLPETHLPDGVLDGGNVLTHWEETGEYLQYVQPKVGALIADLMDAHPDLPEVQTIAAEMRRIQQDYRARLGKQF